MSLKELNDTYLLGNYTRFDFEFVEGQGSYLYDRDGKKYLDFVTGIAVSSMGHNFPPFKEALARQAEKYFHISNLYHIETQAELAKYLVENSDFDKAFFCNSGTEANEAAIKFVRKYFAEAGNEKRVKIVSFTGSFHGRTYGGMAATGQGKIQKGFGPMLDGFVSVPWNDVAALEAVIDDTVAAIMLEPLQGEGGVNPPSPEFITAINGIQESQGVKVIADEIQVGLGRLGAIIASDRVGLFPDIVTFAKPLAGGLPLGSVLLKEEIAQAIKPGDHGTTFGGNPLACAVGVAFLKELIREGFMEDVQSRSTALYNGLNILAAMYPFLGEVRGDGFIWGMEADLDIPAVIKRCAEKGLLIIRAGSNVLRFLPPINATVKEIKEGVLILKEVFEEFNQEVTSGTEKI